MSGSGPRNRLSPAGILRVTVLKPSAPRPSEPIEWRPCPAPRSDPPAARCAGGPLPVSPFWPCPWPASPWCSVPSASSRSPPSPRNPSPSWWTRGCPMASPRNRWRPLPRGSRWAMSRSPCTWSSANWSGTSTATARPVMRTSCSPSGMIPRIRTSRCMTPPVWPSPGRTMATTTRPPPPSARPSSTTGPSATDPTRSSAPP
ncbi:hypothetical protein ACFFX0_16760 [Citricoccus parietis]|uniref:Uncharacterized protein n=1 Tax=Citricoccus parietis TaxID=592307 RepID=A0ABV5G1E7_9MICC